MTDDQAQVPPPETRKWRDPLLALLYFGITSLLLMKIVPQFEEVFRQVKVPMPTLTLGLMSLSAFCCAHPILVALIATGVPASIHGWPPRAVSIGRVAMPILFVIMWGWMVVAVLLPLMSSLKSIGSRGY